MMQKISVIICLFALPFFCLSQNDSQLYNKFMTQFQQQNFKAAIETGNQYISKVTVKDTVYLEFLRYLAFSYYNTGDYQSAVDKYSDARDLAASLLGKENYNYIMCTYNLAINNSYTGTYSRAFELMEEVIAFIIKDQTKNSQDYINTATQFANIYTMAGCIDKAEKTYEEIFEVIKANYAETDSAYWQFANTIATFYLQNGLYDKAEPFYTSSVKQMETTFGKQNVNYITAVNSLGEFYLLAGKYAEMEKVFSDYVNVCGEYFGKTSADYATALNNLAVAYEKQGKNKEAEELYIQCLKIKEKVFKKESNFYALTLSNYAVLCENMGKSSQAEKLLDEAIDIYRKVYGDENDNYHVALSNMAYVYSESGRFEKAIELLRKAEELQKKKYGEKYAPYINTLSTLAGVYERYGKFDIADSLYLKTAELRKSVLGASHTDYATTLSGLAHLKIIRGRYSEAEKLLKEALEIQKKAVGENHSSYLNCLISIAGLYSNMGNYSHSGEIYAQCNEKALTVFGDLNPEYGAFLNNYGQYFCESGEYDKAEEMLRKALQIEVFALGNDNPDNVNILSNLANVMMRKGNYSEAEKFSAEALRITKEKLGVDHPNYAGALLGMGVFYYETGNYERSEKYYLEALEKYRTIKGEKCDEYISVMNNLGALNMARCIQSDDETLATSFALKAEDYLLKALKADSILVGTDHPDYALHLNNIAEFYRNTGQFEKSEKMHLTAIEKTIKVFGESNPTIAASYHNIGLLYTAVGEYTKAEEYCRKALEIKQRTYGTDNPECSDVMSSLAYVYQEMGKSNEAAELYIKAMNLNYELLRKNFSFLSEEEKSNYYATISHYNDMFASFVLSSEKKGNECSSLMNNILVNKGLLLRSGSEMRDEILNGKNKVLIAKYYEWIGLRQQLSKLYSTPEKDRYLSVEETEEKANVLEKELVSAISSGNLMDDIFKKNWKEIAASLSQNEAAVEIGHYRKLEKDNNYSDNYFAMIVKQGSEAPVAIELFEADDFNGLVGNNTGSSIKSVAALYSGSGLYDLVFKHIEKELLGTNKIYFSPDGLLHKVSFAAIKDSSGQYLSAKFDMNIVSSTGLIAENRNASALVSRPDACLFGGAIFSDGEEPAGGWKYLDGTLTETRNIGKILTGVRMPVKTFSGKEASEENLKNLSGKNAPSIIHLATHGFFYPGENENKRSEVVEAPVFADLSFRGGASSVLNFMKNPNPLMRSGLVLSGANNTFTGKAVEGEDGVLTAYEVSNMNLNKTQLIVLSACETGLGDIKGSEGVYGLQRAFKIAGVKFIVMSLWQVPDKETAEFMETFYTKLLLLKDIRKAFNETQNVMRKKYDPYYWAAFVLVE